MLGAGRADPFPRSVAALEALDQLPWPDHGHVAFRECQEVEAGGDDGVDAFGTGKGYQVVISWIVADLKMRRRGVSGQAGDGGDVGNESRHLVEREIGARSRPCENRRYLADQRRRWM